MEISTPNRCKKMALPNGKVVDLLTPVLVEIQKWLQDEPGKPESGGFIVGYKHKETGNISLEEVSHPYLLDHKSSEEKKLLYGRLAHAPAEQANTV